MLQQPYDRGLGASGLCTPKGHARLRLVFRCPNSIHYQRNFNSGGNVAEETEADARVATVTVLHDARHPSFLELALIR